MAYPQFPYIIFEVVWYVLVYVLTPSFPYLALLMHYHMRSNEGRPPAVEHLVAIEVGCIVSLVCTVFLFVCMVVMQINDDFLSWMECSGAFALGSVLIVIPMTISAFVGWGIAKVWAEEQKIRKSEKEQG